MKKFLFLIVSLMITLPAYNSNPVLKLLKPLLCDSSVQNAVKNSSLAFSEGALWLGAYTLVGAYDYYKLDQVDDKSILQLGKERLDSYLFNFIKNKNSIGGFKNIEKSWYFVARHCIDVPLFAYDVLYKKNPVSYIENQCSVIALRFISSVIQKQNFQLFVKEYCGFLSNEDFLSIKDFFISKVLPYDQQSGEAGLYKSNDIYSENIILKKIFIRLSIAISETLFTLIFTRKFVTPYLEKLINYIKIHTLRIYFFKLKNI